MSKNQYYPEDFFSYELVEEIMKEYTWPEPYELIDEDISVEIKFRKCTIGLSSDGQGSTDFEFVSYKGKNINLHPSLIFEVTDFSPRNLDLEEIEDVWPNLEDTKRYIRNDFMILQAFFLPFIKGDVVSWLEDAKNWKASQ